MARKLVIVESPAKAKTIRSYLGPDYEVEASVGHIRDLPLNGKSLPVELRKKWWADYAVDIDNGFEPIYEVPREKAAQVARLRAAMKGKDTLVLATDEDREGESISWHLLQVLKPAKGVAVQRIAFHEITRDAIQDALHHPRAVDQKLVEAQETRRILDRLYGYALSPVLWSTVNKKLSAGRVQSPAVKLIVEREEARRRFHVSVYWDLRATLSKSKAGEPAFAADLRSIDGRRVATGEDFDDETGQLAPTKGQPPLLLDEDAANGLTESARTASPWTVKRLESKEGVEKPAPPFMTTTLQQEANRKFGFAADRTMRIAQQLYEGVDIGGEQVGLITYMRTDSLALSDEALRLIRRLIERDYPDCLPAQAQRYASKVRNAQEAHEAIRPTDPDRKPDTVARYLSEDQGRLYDLIWKRAVASQMKPARVLKTEVEIAVNTGERRLRFATSGKQILFDGFRRLYIEGSDDPDSERERMERRLPILAVGMELSANSVEPLRHETKPPPRFTDATLIKRLEELGIGRPSTYASIIGTIVDRGYVRKQGRLLFPTFRAMLAIQVLESGFAEFMELGFTVRMDEVLDEIANGAASSRAYLTEFFLGSEGQPGLREIVQTRRRSVPYPAYLIGPHPQTGEPIVVRSGKDGGAFLQQGESSARRFANVPDDVAPADLGLEAAVGLLEQKTSAPESIGVHPVSGRRLLLRHRNGYYIEVERTEEELAHKLKPTWISLPPGEEPRNLSERDVALLCSLPKSLGAHPASGEQISLRIGKYGAYVESGAERRTVEDWREAAEWTPERAAQALSEPPKHVATKGSISVLKELGLIDGSTRAVRVMSGRFGPYVTDGEVNATLPRGSDPMTLTPDAAAALLAHKRAQGPSPRPRRFAKARAAPSRRKKVG
ncbi:MAG: type I DNA topoisomerase [Fimbriimonas ginsengisoli]|uniref:DNA topoisomerase 1 n=1 Tax=Fimbriimonas ginsengisoli TaxID=1005039 RepID=A0A931M0T7_FIMGI|nr:type I DNA topoisomerase [Fimbriimonas ginsengisoli]